MRVAIIAVIGVGSRCVLARHLVNLWRLHLGLRSACFSHALLGRVECIGKHLGGQAAEWVRARLHKGVVHPGGGLCLGGDGLGVDGCGFHGFVSVGE